MADEPEIVVKLRGDITDIKKSVDELKGKLEQTERDTNKANFFTGLSGSIIAVNQGLELAKKAAQLLQDAFNFAKLGEETLAINKRFEMIAQSAGLIPESISSGIEKAVKGTVDMEDALQSASRAITILGDNSDRIPKIFELAKKATALYGGEVTDRFEAISQAIATGATRQLRGIGLIINAEEAYKKYAIQIGSATESLTEAQKQQALMNAVLEKGNQNFKNIDSSLTPLSEKAKKLSVSFGELGETLSIVMNKYFGGTLKSAIDSIRLSFDDLTNGLKQSFLNARPTIEQEIDKIQNKITRLEEMKLSNFNNPTLQTEIDSLNEKLEKLVQRKQMSAAADAIQSEADEKAIDTLSRRNEQGAISNAQLEEQKMKLEALRGAQEEYENSLKRLPTYSNFITGFSDAMDSLVGTTMDLGRTMAGTFKNGVTQAFGALGKGLVDGGNGLDEFGKSMLGMLGQLAMQVGSFLFFAGLGFSMLPLGFSGAGAIAAGLALMVLGGVLSGLAGGSTGANAGGSSAAGTASDNGGAINQDYQGDEETRTTPQTGVTVNIQGNVLDRRQTGLEIAEILNEAFDTDGVTVRAVSGLA